MMTVDNLSVWLENWLNEYGIESVEEYGINVIEDSGLYCLKYGSYTQGIKTETIVRACRGSVVTNVDGVWKVVAYAFDRFFNLGEVESEFNFNNYQVQEKLDGSLIKMYWHDNHWVISTSGTPTGKSKVNGHDITFDKLFWDVFDYLDYCIDEFNTDYCYVWELCTDYNRIVVNYEEPKLVLLTVRDRNNNFNEVWPHYMSEFVETPNSFYCYSRDEVYTELVKLNGAEQEGYVLVDAKGNRLKLKTELYVKLHSYKTKNRVSFAELLKSDNVDEFLTYFPEYKKRFESYTDAIVALDYECDRFVKDHSWWEQKEFASAAINSFLPADALFSIRKGKYRYFIDWLVDQNIKKIQEVLNCD